MTKLNTLISLFLDGIIYVLSFIIPKETNTWVFGAWFGKKYSDNSKAFFEYVVKQQPHIHAVWITKDKSLMHELKNKGVNVFYFFSLQGLWIQLRASYAFVCQALPDDLHAPAIGKKTHVVNLWHGLPLKKIMYDVFDKPKVGSNIFGRIESLLTPYNKIRNDYLISTSEETQKTLSNAFKVPLERTLITGFPRNDVLLNAKSSAIPKKSFSCIYMPTFRGGIGAECDLFFKYGFDVKGIDEKLTQNNIKLYLRMHPVNHPPANLVAQIKDSRSMFFDNSEDIFDTLPNYDCMITDYSGAFFDFLIMNKPILFAPFDLSEYIKNERDLYYDYTSVTLEPYANSWDSLINNLINTSKNPILETERTEYQDLVNRFHAPNSKNIDSFSKLVFEQFKPEKKT